MLDELLELFDRDKRRPSGGGLRGRLARAIGGHGDERHASAPRDDRRRDWDDDDEDDARDRSHRRRRAERFDLD
jgi:hypothetical protein